MCIVKSTTQINLTQISSLSFLIVLQSNKSMKEIWALMERKMYVKVNKRKKKTWFWMTWEEVNNDRILTFG